MSVSTRPPAFSSDTYALALRSPPPEPGVERIVELDSDDPHVIVQGEDQNLGHMHLSQTDNPGEVYLRVTLALRGGITTLWMLAAVLTAGLLWLVHHHGSYGKPAEQNKQIAAAVLLVGPAFASAWSLRAEGSELLRTSLSGARFLLLASAALSVASALALAGVFPSGSNRYEAIEIYAFGWLPSRGPVNCRLAGFLATDLADLPFVPEHATAQPRCLLGDWSFACLLRPAPRGAYACPRWRTAGCRPGSCCDRRQPSRRIARP